MSAYTDLILGEGSLLSLWPLDDTSGATATDLKGAKNGAYQASPTLGVRPGAIPADPRGAVQFLASSSQYVSVASPNQPAQLSYEVWVYNLVSGGWSDLGGIGQWNTNGALLYLPGPSGVTLFINGGSLAAGADATRLNGWHHYVVTYDGTNGAVYVDGILKAGPTALTGPITYAGSFLIAQYGAPSGTFWSGRMAMAAQYNAALTAAQVQNHWAVGINPNYAARRVVLANRNVGPQALRRQFHRRVWSPDPGTSGPVANQTTLTGALSFTGVLGKGTGKSLGAILSFTGALVRAIRRTLTATLSMTASLAKRTARTLTGALSFAGSVATLKAFGKALTAALSFTGSQNRRTGKQATSTLSFAGALPRGVSRGLGATLGFSGTIAKRTARLVAASLAFSGTMTTLKAFGKILTASLSFSGTQVRQVRKALGAALGFVGTMVRQSAKSMAGGLSFATAIGRRTSRMLGAGLSFTGTIGRQAARTFVAGLGFAASIVAAIVSTAAAGVVGRIPGGAVRFGRPAGTVGEEQPGGAVIASRPPGGSIGPVDPGGEVRP